MITWFIRSADFVFAGLYIFFFSEYYLKNIAEF